MDENDLCGISVVSDAVGGAFCIPVSHLLNVLSATCETYAIIGTKGQVHFKDLNNFVHIFAFPYRSASSLIISA